MMIQFQKNAKKIERKIKVPELVKICENAIGK